MVYEKNCAIFRPQACWYLLLLFDTTNSHYVLIKGFNELSSSILKSKEENCLVINHIKSVLLPEEAIYNEFRISNFFLWLKKIMKILVNLLCSGFVM